MFDLWRAQRRRRKNERDYASYVKRARKEGESQDEIELLYHEWGFERDLIDDDINWLLTERLLREANKLDIPTPKPGDQGEWDQATNPSRWHLTIKARNDLRNQIRVEKKERSKRWQRWITLSTGLVLALAGLAGALTGLLVIFYQ